MSLALSRGIPCAWSQVPLRFQVGVPWASWVRVYVREVWSRALLRGCSFLLLCDSLGSFHHLLPGHLVRATCTCHGSSCFSSSRGLRRTCACSTSRRCAPASTSSTPCGPWAWSRTWPCPPSPSSGTRALARAPCWRLCRAWPSPGAAVRQHNSPPPSRGPQSSHRQGPGSSRSHIPVDGKFTVLASLCPSFVLGVPLSSHLALTWPLLCATASLMSPPTTSSAWSSRCCRTGPLPRI